MMNVPTPHSPGHTRNDILSRSVRWILERNWLTVSFAAWWGGVLARFAYILDGHHARNHVVSDAVQLTDLAKRLVDAPLSQTIYDTIWPPGTSATLALFMARDPSLSGAAVLQFLLSCAVPLLFAHAAYLVAGERVAIFTLFAATFDFGLIHYGGFFLSEQFFQFTIALAIWSTVVALYISQPAGTSVARTINRILLGTVPGATWALATAFRPTALPVALMLGGVLLFYWSKRRCWQSMYLLLGAAASFVLLMAPIAQRCSRLSGTLCPVSTNFAMNVALGQLEGNWGIDFVDASHPNLTTGWVPPIMIDHGYRGMLTIPYSIYDTGHLALWVWHRFTAAPGSFLLRCLRNMLDLFQLDLWPSDFAPLSDTAANVWTRAFGWFILAPGFVGLWRTLRGLVTSAADGLAKVACSCILLSIMAISAFSMGEGRYRTPFDGVIIIFAGIALIDGRQSGRASRLIGPRALTRAMAAGGVLAVAWLGLIEGASIPSWGLAHTIRRSAVHADIANSDVRKAAEFERRVAPHTPWDAGTNYRFLCRPTCRELRLEFDQVQFGRQLEVSADSNDAYRISFYRGAVGLGFSELTHERGPDMRVDVINVPDTAASGYDAVGLIPLYGDGAYAIGHVRIRH